MTTSTPASPVLGRALTRAALLCAVLAVVLVAAPAQAAPPEGWSDPDPVPVLNALVVYVFGPLALGGLTVLGALLTTLARGQRDAAPVASDGALDILAGEE